MVDIDECGLTKYSGNESYEELVGMLILFLEYADKLGLLMALKDENDVLVLFNTPDVRSVCEQWEQMTDEVKNLAFNEFLKELFDVIDLNIDHKHSTIEFIVEPLPPLTEGNNHFDFVKLYLDEDHIFVGPFVLLPCWLVNVVIYRGMDIINKNGYDVRYDVLNENKYNETYEMTATIVQDAMEIVVKAHTQTPQTPQTTELDGIESPGWCEVKATMGGTTVTHYRGSKR